MNGNPIELNVKFEKVFADINLDQASTLFTVTLDNMEVFSNDEITCTQCQAGNLINGGLDLVNGRCTAY